MERTLRIGFVPLADCAPLVMAHELGLFEKHGLSVSLQRELGWATIRDKIIHRELEAAHALAAMPFAATLGVGSIPCDCLTALVLNLNGNAITLSNELWKRGVRDGSSLQEEIVRSRRGKTLTFGVVSLISGHHHLLRTWLSSSKINPDKDVRIVVVPPPQMVVNLTAGHLDGFCVGEPWNSVAIQSHEGWCAATSAELQPNHPEKVLMLRRDFAEQHLEEHVAMAAALIEACTFCEAPDNRDEMIATLSQPQYVNVSREALNCGFEGRFDFGHGKVRNVPGFTLFHANSANEPSADKAAWAFELVRSSGLCKQPSSLQFASCRNVYRPDIFEQALGLIEQKEEKIQDGNPAATNPITMKTFVGLPAPTAAAN